MNIQKWHGIHGRHILKQLEKQNKRAKNAGVVHSKPVQTVGRICWIDIDIPVVFSVERSMDDTVRFFSDFQKKLEEAEAEKKSIYISFKNTEYIGVEALMHLIALMIDANNKGIRIAGDRPPNDESYDKLKKYGFFKFVRTNKYIVDEYSNDTLKIQKGRNANPEIASQLCSFAHQHGGYDRVGTMPLYEILIEMMKNTLDHAFKEKGKNNYWYVFAEDNDEYIKYAFLDTGQGVPHTMRRKWYEKFLGVEDVELVKSALLSEEERSATKQGNRGQGLPKIHENSRTEIFREMHIITGRAYCTINPDVKQLEMKALEEKMPGTLYSWKIRKGV